MIRDATKEKRLQWDKENIEEIDLGNVIFSDNTTVQMENHRRTCCFKRDRKPQYKPRPKHQAASLGRHQCVRTNICIFEGKMNAPLYVSF